MHSLSVAAKMIAEQSGSQGLAEEGGVGPYIQPWQSIFEQHRSEMDTQEN